MSVSRMAGFPVGRPAGWRCKQRAGRAGIRAFAVSLAVLAGLAVLTFLAVAPSGAAAQSPQVAQVANSTTDSVSVIDTATNTFISRGAEPIGVSTIVPTPQCVACGPPDPDPEPSPTVPEPSFGTPDPGPTKPEPSATKPEPSPTTPEPTPATPTPTPATPEPPTLPDTGGPGKPLVLIGLTVTALGIAFLAIGHLPGRRPRNRT
jgi:YVTN family beta-propeller protein